MKIQPAQILRPMAVLMTLALAAALCLSCLELYTAGIAPENFTPEGVRIHDIYTRENVGAALAKLAPAAVCWGILLALSAMQPRQPEKRAAMDPENALRLLRPQVEQTPAMAFQQKLRRIYRVVTGVVLAVCLGWIALYMTDVSHFTSWDLEAVMGQMVGHLALPAGLAVVSLCICPVLLGRSYKAEWRAAKEAPRRAEPAQKAEKPKPFPVGAARIVLAVVAVIFLVAGIFNGGMYDVLVKAIKICTECIGLG